MRDPVLNEALRRLAAEAATRLSTLVAGGEQIPFDVAEQAGPDSVFHSYRPLTGEFVRRREDQLRDLPSFGPARDAVAAADVAAPYLERHGGPVPSEPRERAARMLTEFFATLWDGSTEFALDRECLDGALAALDAAVRDAHEADVLIVPIVGLRTNARRLDLPHGMKLVDAATVDAPVEAMRSEGMGRAAWEPQFLAIAEQGEGSESAAEALRQLEELVSVMRLFKAGGIGLGPYAFAPTGDGNWRRVSTGAPATRPGGYRLDEEEARALASFAADLEVRPDPSGALAWAVQRFELGCGRLSALEGLSDHLLALRAVLDGKGPVGASRPMRAAALIDGGDRVVARERVEAALELERALMRGAAHTGTAGLAEWVEESVRGILREAALGRLGSDLGSAADDTLIATGLAGGDAEASVSAEEYGDTGMSGREAADVPHVERTPPANHHEPPEEADMEDTRIMEPVPAEDEIRISAANWLEEVEVEESTLDFPAIEGDLERRERIDTPTVRHLFPVPEDADWEVRELDYDHYRRRAG